MVNWTRLNTRKINRVGYNEKINTLYVDFKGNEKETIFLKVPAEMYEVFKSSKSPDDFYDQFVEGYFDILSPGVISSAMTNQK